MSSPPSDLRDVSATEQAPSGATIRASCDSCRKKKNKCTSERTGCSMCLKRGIDCVYSPKGRLGRPRKDGSHVDTDTEPYKRVRQNSSNDTQKRHSYHSSTQSPSIVSQAQMVAPRQFGHLLGAVEVAAAREPPYDVAQQYHAMHSSTGQSPAIDPMLDTFDFNHYPNMSPDLHHSATHREAFTPDISKYRTGSTSQHLAATDHAANPILRSPQSTRSAPVLPAPTLPCACLANHYLITSQLQAIATSTSATQTFTEWITNRITTYQSALTTTRDILTCTQCMNTHISGAHNVMLVLGLLTGIAMAYESLINDVRAEAEQAERAKRPIECKLFEVATVTQPRIANATDQSGLAVALPPSAWRDAILSTIRKDIYPASASSSPAPPWYTPAPSPSCGTSTLPTTADTRTRLPPTPTSLTASYLNSPDFAPPGTTLSALISAMEARQQHVHAAIEAQPHAHLSEGAAQAIKDCASDGYNCLRHLKYVRAIMERLNT